MDLSANLITIGALLVFIAGVIINYNRTKLWSYKQKEASFSLIMRIYFVLAGAIIILCPVSYWLNKYNPTLIVNITDEYVLRVLKRFNKWVDEKKITSYISTGFCIVALIQYSLSKLKENLNSKEHKAVLFLYAFSKFFSWVYLGFTIVAAYLKPDNNEEFNVVSHISFFLAFWISFVEWNIIERKIELFGFFDSIMKCFKHHEPTDESTDKATDKAFLVDVCSNADIQCVHKSYTVRWHEHDS